MDWPARSRRYLTTPTSANIIYLLLKFAAEDLFNFLQFGKEAREQRVVQSVWNNSLSRFAPASILPMSRTTQHFRRRTGAASDVPAITLALSARPREQAGKIDPPAIKVRPGVEARFSWRRG